MTESLAWVCCLGNWFTVLAAKGTFIMLRKLGTSVVLALLVVGLALAQERQADQKGQQGKPTQATITKVDPAKNTVTLKMRDQTGKDTERTLNLKDDNIRLYDEGGKLATADRFKTGTQVWVIEKDGKISELRQARPGQKDPFEKPKN
jgi:hypothetical protein